MPKYYPINEEAAKRAKDMNSFSDYQPGSATAGYRAMVDEAYAAAERQKARVDPMYHDKIDALVDRYARKLAENLNERNVIDARVPSILISGGGNFPVAKKHKQNAARDRNYGECAEISKLLDKIRSVGMGGISADDDLAVEKLTKKLEGLESLQATMKAVNAYFRKHKTLDGCPELTPEQAEKLKADMAQSWHLDKSKPYPAYLLSNNNANIRRVRQRIEELSSRSEFAGWTFPGGEAKINEAENRLQLIFEEKPDADQRQELKSNGFKWAPSQGAWQRQLNQNAIRAAARIDFLRPEDGTSPYQLQPFVKRENKEMDDLLNVEDSIVRFQKLLNLQLPCFEYNGKYYISIKKDDYIQIDKELVEKYPELYMRNTKMIAYKFVHKVGDKYYSYYDERYEYKIGQEQLPNNRFLYVCRYKDLKNTTYKDEKDKALLKCEIDLKDIENLNNAQLEVKKLKVLEIKDINNESNVDELPF